MNKAIMLICLLFLIGCTTGKQEDKYKILWGKRCTESGNQYSYVWFHSVLGEETVKKEWCKNG